MSHRCLQTKNIRILTTYVAPTSKRILLRAATVLDVHQELARVELNFPPPPDWSLRMNIAKLLANQCPRILNAKRYETCATDLLGIRGKRSMLTSICTVPSNQHPRRFPITHDVMEANKIRMNYIESEMAKRHHRVPIDLSDPGPAHGNEGGSGGQSRPELPQREPASMGKLHEIDLGQETKLHNIARTEAATRRFADDEGDKEVPAEMVPPAKGKKPSRGRRRRNSEDVERDRLVDEVLRESKRSSTQRPTLSFRFLTDIQRWQWTFTMNPRKTTIQMTRRRMTRLLNNSGANSLTRSSHGAVWHGRGTQSRPRRRPREDRNWEAAGVLEQPCGRCRRSQDRNKPPFDYIAIFIYDCDLVVPVLLHVPQ